MLHQLVLSDWLKVVNIYQILSVLQHNKPLSSMEIYHKLVKKDSSMSQHFAAFSKLLCGILPHKGIIQRIEGTKILYTIPEKVPW